mmetsp:Transcript_17455/g.58949  ORF Transcript_17455/g.58949 Transcript_17455/m.58949 type:complete len:318 (+) Transcript_17455:656-1609(+)
MTTVPCRRSTATTARLLRTSPCTPRKSGAARTLSASSGPRARPRSVTTARSTPSQRRCPSPLTSAFCAGRRCRCGGSPRRRATSASLQPSSSASPSGPRRARAPECRGPCAPSAFARSAAARPPRLRAARARGTARNVVLDLINFEPPEVAPRRVGRSFAKMACRSWLRLEEVAVLLPVAHGALGREELLHHLVVLGEEVVHLPTDAGHRGSVAVRENVVLQKLLHLVAVEVHDVVEDGRRLGLGRRRRLLRGDKVRRGSGAGRGGGGPRLAALRERERLSRLVRGLRLQLVRRVLCLQRRRRPPLADCDGAAVCGD